MPIRVIGLNNRTATIETREIFSFDASGVKAALEDWKKRFPEAEAALVSTCNRTELYFATERGVLPSDVDVFPFLIAPKHKSDDPPVSFERFASVFQTFDNVDAIKRLFSVASSLDSMILGEPQILSQVKRAYDIALATGSAGPILNGAFQTAFKTAKRISVETGVFKRRVSVPSVAVVDFALNIFERVNDKRTLVLGAGEMAEETLKYLVDYGAKSIGVANRSRDKAEALASKWNGRVVDWEDRVDALTSSDLVICATGASEPIVDLKQCEKGIEQRVERPLFILDLAVPRNVDPELGKCPNVYLYSVDDLEKACARNKELRDKEIPKATRIVDEEASGFVSGVNARRSIDAIKTLRENWSKIKDEEVERLLRKIDCDQREEAEIRYAFERLVNKLLHSPTVSLRAEAEQGPNSRLLEAMRRLFKL
ncbi:MAG: glutamyl-tRNA reductase [Thermoguttaceae bacterium]|nr:glutamyl-tRNA reductase [Thermoguttaceae bacterium]